MVFITRGQAPTFSSNLRVSYAVSSSLQKPAELAYIKCRYREVVSSGRWRRGRQCLSLRHANTVTVLVSDDNPPPAGSPRPPTPHVGTRLTSVAGSSSGTLHLLICVSNCTHSQIHPNLFDVAAALGVTTTSFSSRMGNHLVTKDISVSTAYLWMCVG